MNRTTTNLNANFGGAILVQGPVRLETAPTVFD
jgi:hypothetical protein